MEGARDVAVIPASDLAWNDIGSWEALLDVLAANVDGNVVIGAEHLGLETRGVLIHSSGSHPERLVATVGVSDMIIVDTEDVLLVCPRERAQDVRALVDQLKQRAGGSEYL